MTEDNENNTEEIIDLYFTNEELAKIAQAAHIRDLTINEFINEALREELSRLGYM